MNHSNLPPRYLRTPKAARFLSLSGPSIEKHRCYGTGPAYRKVGGRVIYAMPDLVAWAERVSRFPASWSRRLQRAIGSSGAPPAFLG